MCICTAYINCQKAQHFYVFSELMVFSVKIGDGGGGIQNIHVCHLLRRKEGDNKSIS